MENRKFTGFHMGALLFFKESADGFHHFICAVALDLVQHICDSGFKSGYRAQIISRVLHCHRPRARIPLWYHPYVLQKRREHFCRPTQYKHHRPDVRQQDPRLSVPSPGKTPDRRPKEAVRQSGSFPVLSIYAFRDGRTWLSIWRWNSGRWTAVHGR